MPSPEPTRAPTAGPARAVHVERTDDPCVLRWVVHDADVGRGAPGAYQPHPDGPLAGLVAEGAVVEARAGGGAVDVRVLQASDWPALVARAHAALLRECDLMAGRRPARPGPGLPGSLDAVQAVVDAAAGAVAGGHGGRIEVVGVAPGEVRVRLHGACRGCAATAGTLDGRVAPALATAFGGPVRVVDGGGRRRGLLRRGAAASL